MAILNYTTEVPAAKSLGQVTEMLAAARAQAILTEFDEQGQVVAISFRIKGPWGMMSFRLPGQVEMVYRVLIREKVPPRYQTREHAARVAWRIVKDWLEAQLALIRVQMVTLEQVFLPFAQDQQGRTLYETLKDGGFSGLALPERRAE